MNERTVKVHDYKKWEIEEWSDGECRVLTSERSHASVWSGTLEECKAWVDWKERPCVRLRLNFHAVPDELYSALLAEFRRQFPDYMTSDKTGSGILSPATPNIPTATRFMT